MELNHNINTKAYLYIKLYTKHQQAVENSHYITAMCGYSYELFTLRSLSVRMMSLVCGRNAAGVGVTVGDGSPAEKRGILNCFGA